MEKFSLFNKACLKEIRNEKSTDNILNKRKI
jgi:hypothetical protein